MASVCRSTDLPVVVETTVLILSLAVVDQTNEGEPNRLNHVSAKAIRSEVTPELSSIPRARFRLSSESDQCHTSSTDLLRPSTASAPTDDPSDGFDTGNNFVKASIAIDRSEETADVSVSRREETQRGAMEEGNG